VEKEKLEHELQVARRIQSSLLPAQRPVSPGCDFGALMQPMSAVGGDFYDFVEFPDGRVGIAVGDVSDHGVPAALFMSMTVTLLRTAARRDASGSAAEPAAVLRSVNRGLLEFDMSGMFVTVLYGVFDPRQREFSYARAGHEQPLLQVAPDPVAPTAPPANLPHSAEETGVWIVDRSAWSTATPKPAAPSRRKGKTKILTDPLEKKGAGDTGRKILTAARDEGPLHETERTPVGQTGSVPGAHPAADPSSSFRRGQVLGVVPDPDLDVQRLLLPAHSLLLLATDGAREAWDPAGRMFGEHGLRAILAEAAQLPAQAICEQIFERLVSHRGPAPQQDDITRVAVKA